MVSRKIETIISKTGLPVLQIEHEGKMMLIHSKYDPVKEAEQILSNYEDQIDQFQHVLFYGVGLGYHVKAFLERYPEKLASTYEPIREAAVACAASQPETKLPASELKYTFVEKEPGELEHHLHTFSNQLTQKVMLIILPTYERFLKEDIIRFIGKFKEIIDEKQSNIGANEFFSKRWTINSLMNLPSTFENPNFLLEHTETFRDKPVILAAAGPSLSEEMENLREIKDKGLAYVFAVGSANKALIANGIYPDAVFTYDPQAHNYAVFQPIIDGKINTIPLVYGTSVGFETVQRYPGPQFHFVTAQDTITQLFHETALRVIDDAYSIAIVTLQLLYQLQVKTIILAGQNFAFNNDLFYSKEINRYDKEKKEISDASLQKKDLEVAFTVADVNGNSVMTNKSFNNMRILMERYIKQTSQIPVVNTSRGGAAIAGTTYIPLSQLMEEELIERVVTEGWYEKETAISLSAQSTKKMIALQKDTAAFIKQNDAIFEHFSDIERSIDRLNENQIQKRLEKIDELMRKLTNNTMYDIIIRPITRNYFEKLQTEVEVLRKLDLAKEKLVAVVNLFSTYLHLCRGVFKETAPIIQAVIYPKLLEDTGRKEYIATSGVFHYEGGWEKKSHQTQETNDTPPVLYTTAVETKQKHTIMKFRFSGTKLAMYGTNHSKGLLKLRISIDNRISNITIKDNVDEELYGSFMRQKLFETTNLKQGMHNITIEITSDNPHLLFQGIEIDKDGRAYHIQEVTNIDGLEIGKRIRCHYKATYNTVGKFAGLGQELGKHLPVEAIAEPDGDFYFIMVDEIDGKKKLIADRNVQNYISWDTLNKQGLTSMNGVGNLISSLYSVQIGLPDGEHNGNEWDRICASFLLEEQFGILFRQTYAGSLMKNSSYCLLKDKTEMVMLRGSYFNINIPGFCGEDLNYSVYTSSAHITFNIGFRPIIQFKEIIIL